jgi:hypothetical protein
VGASISGRASRTSLGCAATEPSSERVEGVVDEHLTQRPLHERALEGQVCDQGPEGGSDQADDARVLGLVAMETGRVDEDEGRHPLRVPGGDERGRPTSHAVPHQRRPLDLQAIHEPEDRTGEILERQVGRLIGAAEPGEIESEDLVVVGQRRNDVLPRVER